LRQQLAAARKAYNDFLATVRNENNEQVSLMNVEPLTLKEVQSRLDANITLVEYFIVNDAVILWVVEQDKINSFRVPIRRADIRTKVTAFRKAITDLGETEKLNLLSRELYKLLIQPA
jgi:CHAT domain-containing protein